MDYLHQYSIGSSALHACTSSGKCEIVKLLLSRGADVDAKPEIGTPLTFAALRGHESTVEVLLEYHADVIWLYHLLEFVLSLLWHEKVHNSLCLLQPNKLVTSCLATPLEGAVRAASTPCVKLLIQVYI
jgi:ankyrin repeat protein